ncbi:hypothetical protein POTOM_011757 [Populus tomentosa]|uniref:Uncharacterized protein n=1 Tax=Populus tomentosa TaxID=118781 RepID=A0A8X8ADH2_POPTO|nr:hypothetical protein POTOM_011757 [Populus tomentosa]
MGLPMVAVAKLNLLSRTRASLVTFLLFPYVLKLTFTVRLFRRAYTGLLHSSRLFLFQLSQIAFDTDQPAPIKVDTAVVRPATIQSTVLVNDAAKGSDIDPQEAQQTLEIAPPSRPNVGLFKTEWPGNTTSNGALLSPFSLSGIPVDAEIRREGPSTPPFISPYKQPIKGFVVHQRLNH